MTNSITHHAHCGHVQTFEWRERDAFQWTLMMTVIVTSPDNKKPRARGAKRSNQWHGRGAWCTQRWISKQSPKTSLDQFFFSPSKQKMTNQGFCDLALSLLGLLLSLT